MEAQIDPKIYVKIDAEKEHLFDPLLRTCLVSEREARDNNQTCRHVSPHAAEWRSLQLLVAVCRILSMCIRVSVCIWTCLHVFARICTYVRVPARICAYLRVFACICAYLRVSARICTYFVRLCAFLLVSARICTYSQELLKIISKCSKKEPQNDSQNPPKTIPKCTLGGSRDGVWLCARFALFWDQFWGPFWAPFWHQKIAKNQ